MVFQSGMLLYSIWVLYMLGLLMHVLQLLRIHLCTLKSQKYHFL